MRVQARLSDLLVWIDMWVMDHVRVDIHRHSKWEY